MFLVFLFLEQILVSSQRRTRFTLAPRELFATQDAAVPPNPAFLALSISSIAMELSLLPLSDPLLHLIVDDMPNRARRQLRCVNRRLRGLVDEHLTEIELT